MTSGKIKKEKLSAMTTLRRQWAIAWGGITAAVAIDPFFDGFWTAVTCLVIGIALDRGSSHRRRKINPCVRLMSLAGTALICSAVIMTMITAAERLNLLGDTFKEGHNSAIPYIASLVIYPTAAIIFGIAYLRHGHARYCASCPINRCDVSCSMLTGGLVHRQTRYQMMISTVIAGVIAMVTWIYYAVGYVNINFNRADIAFFVVVPAAFFVISAMSYNAHYRMINSRIIMTDTSDVVVSGEQSKLRFLIIRGDKLLLKNIGPDNKTMDTPAIVTIPYTQNPDEDVIRRNFRKIVDSDDFYLKRLYETPGPSVHSSMFHYGVTIDTNAKIDIEGTWMTLDQIDRLWRHGQLTMALIGEIHRVFSVTMAWKTYDATGRRLYPIKNYRPTFRLADFKDWDVDYDDPKWLRIAEDNQDRPLWAVRRLVKRLFI